MNNQSEIDAGAQEHCSHGHHGLAIGFLTGSVIGAGLAMYFAPRAASEIRKRVLNSASALRDTAAARYRRASAQVGDAVEDLAKKGQNVVDGACDAVAGGAHAVAQGAHEVERGAHGVEQFAVAAKRGKH
jgi:gas vesicle protein